MNIFRLYIIFKLYIRYIMEENKKSIRYTKYKESIDRATNRYLKKKRDERDYEKNKQKENEIIQRYLKEQMEKLK